MKRLSQRVAKVRSSLSRSDKGNADEDHEDLEDHEEEDVQEGGPSEDGDDDEDLEAQQEQEREHARVEAMIEAWCEEEGIEPEEQNRRARVATDLIRCSREPVGFDEKAFILSRLRKITEAAPYVHDLVVTHGMDTLEKFKDLRERDLTRLGVDMWIARSAIVSAAMKWTRVESLNLSMEPLTSLPSGPLELHASLNVSTSVLTHMPNDFTVHGDLDVAFSSLLRELPPGMHVHGDLVAERCVRLRVVGEDLHVGGSLNLKRCESLEQLPVQMDLLTNLVLASCKSLTQLPDNMHIRGNLDLKRCESLEALPNGLTVDGRLTLRYSKVRALPEDTVLNGDLDIADCDGFVLRDGFVLGGSLLVDEWTFGDAFPRDLHIKNNLDLEIFSLACLPPMRVDGTLCVGSSLQEIEGPLHVGRQLKLISCSAAIPPGTLVDGKLELVRCHGRRELRGLKVGSALVLSSCSRIKQIDEIELDGSLRIDNCQSLERLGNATRVAGGVLIRNCHKLRELPEAWKVDSLDVSGTAIEALPSGLEVSNFFRMAHGPLKRLPENIVVGGSVEVLCDIEDLPASLRQVNGDLEIASSKLTSLPSPLRVSQSLRVSQCPMLERLDGDLRVGLDIIADRCYALKTLLPDNFHALGTVSAISCRSLERVGVGIQVEGDLNLREAESLKELDKVYVGRSLILSKCSKLERLGDDVQTGLDLILSSCEALKEVPRAVKTAGVFSLNGCTSMESLDAQLDIGWDLDLRGTSITTLPQRGRVRGDLFAEYLKIREVPANLAIDGHIALRGCTLLETILLPWDTVYSIDLTSTKVVTLPDNLHIKGDLVLSSTDIEALPSGLRVEGLLNVSGCRKLRKLPDDLAVAKSILANDCPLLTSLPSVLRVQSDLFLANATSLLALPEELEVAGRLDCSGCSSLWSAGAHLTVYSNCSFAMCVSLSALPDEMYVGGELDCFGCASIEVLPPDMYVGMGLLLTECIGISTLPAAILSWGPTPSGGRHTIDLTGTSIFEDRIEELRAEASASVHLLVTRPNASPERNFTNLRKAVEFWFDKAGVWAMPTVAPEAEGAEAGDDGDVEADEEVDPGADTDADADAEAEVEVEVEVEAEAEVEAEVAEIESDADGEFGDSEERAAVREALAAEVDRVVPKISLRGVLLFLSKLTVAKEYKREDLRESLAKRVVDVLRLLVDEEDARDELLTRMGDSVDACGDKPIQALNQMAVIVRTVRARGNREALRELAVGIARLQVVQRHAQMKVDSFRRPVDEVVIFLRFEVALAQDLDLPVPAADQLFPHFVLVTEEELSAARVEALQINGQGEEFEAWLSHWSEWQRQLRLEAAKELSFERLKRNSRRFSLSWMDLFGNRMADPVRIGTNSTIWSLRDLLRHWVRTGMDLNNTPRAIEEIRHLTRCRSLPRRSLAEPVMIAAPELDAQE